MRRNRRSTNKRWKLPAADIVYFHGRERRNPLLLGPRFVAHSTESPWRTLRGARSKRTRAIVLDGTTAPQSSRRLARRLRDSGVWLPIIFLNDGRFDQSLATLGVLQFDGHATSAQELASRLETAIEAEDALDELRRMMRVRRRRHRRRYGALVAALSALAVLLLLLGHGCSKNARTTEISQPHASAHESFARRKPAVHSVAEAAHRGPAVAARTRAGASPAPRVPPLAGPVISGAAYVGSAPLQHANGNERFPSGGAKGSGASRTPRASRRPVNRSGANASPGDHAASGGTIAKILGAPIGSGAPDVTPREGRAPRPTLSPSAPPVQAFGHAASAGSLLAPAPASSGVNGHGNALGTHGAMSDPALADALRSVFPKNAVADVSFSVVGADGASLAEHRGSISRTGASTIKLLVAAVALDVLGPDFRFVTTLRTQRVPDGGHIDGDLVLQSDGDPTLTRAALAGGVETLRRRGISAIDGEAVVDLRPFRGSEQNTHWLPSDLQYPYAAGAAAVSIDGNVANGVAVHDIPAYVGTSLAGLVRAEGISVRGSRTIRSGRFPYVLWQRESAPLSSILRGMLASSNNFDAEQLLRKIGSRAGEGSVSGGIREEMQWLHAHGIPLAGVRLFDASGLAPDDRITTSTLAEFLSAMTRDRHAEAFDALLPREFAGAIAAKDGHLARVTGLAGYAWTRKHGRVAFAYLVNHGMTAAQERRLRTAFERSLVRY